MEKYTNARNLRITVETYIKITKEQQHCVFKGIAIVFQVSHLVDSKPDCIMFHQSNPQN
jgi:hypothetical protein